MNPVLSLLIYVVLIPAALAASALPRGVELRLGRFLGRLALRLSSSRVRIARENIRRCLPELKAPEAEALLRKNFEHYGVLALEILHMFSPVPGHFRRYASRVATLENYEAWPRAAKKGKGVLFVSAHLANWELMAARAAIRAETDGLILTIITRRLKPAWLLRRMERSRLSASVKALYQPRTLPGIMRALRAGESVGFVMDQYAPPPMGVPAVFFGARVDTLAAVGSLAQRTGAAIVPVLQQRDNDGRVRIIFEPELDLGEAAKDPRESTQLLVSLVERWIRANPSQWLWAHRRFKNAVWPAPVP